METIQVGYKTGIKINEYAVYEYLVLARHENLALCQLSHRRQSRGFDICSVVSHTDRHETLRCSPTKYLHDYTQGEDAPQPKKMAWETWNKLVADMVRKAEAEATQKAMKAEAEEKKAAALALAREKYQTIKTELNTKKTELKNLVATAPDAEAILTDKNILNITNRICVLEKIVETIK
jgi:hypothetical protein